MNEKKYTNLEIKNIDETHLEVHADLLIDNLEELINHAVQDRAKNMVIPGFRKGEAPVEVAKKYINTESIKQEVLKKQASEALAQIIIENQLKVVGTPEVEINDTGDKVSIVAKLVLLPEVKLKDGWEEAIKKVNAEEIKVEEVKDEDVDTVITHLKREKARIIALEAMHKSGKKVEMPDINSIPEDKLPQLDEKDFKELAGASNLEEFRQKVKENIKTERELAAKEKRRAEIAEELIKHAELNLPEEIVELELQRAYAQMEQDLQMMGLTLDAYLAQINKSKDEFEAEMRETARKRAILQLALDKVAEEKNITVNPEDVEKELSHILSHNPNLDKNEVRAFVEAQMSNNKVLEYLENLK